MNIAVNTMQNMGSSVINYSLNKLSSFFQSLFPELVKAVNSTIESDEKNSKTKDSAALFNKMQSIAKKKDGKKLFTGKNEKAINDLKKSINYTAFFRTESGQEALKDYISDASRSPNFAEGAKEIVNCQHGRALATNYTKLAKAVGGSDKLSVLGLAEDPRSETVLKQANKVQILTSKFGDNKSGIVNLLIENSAENKSTFHSANPFSIPESRAADVIHRPRVYASICQNNPENLQTLLELSPTKFEAINTNSKAMNNFVKDAKKFGQDTQEAFDKITNNMTAIEAESFLSGYNDIRKCVSVNPFNQAIHPKVSDTLMDSVCINTISEAAKSGSLKTVLKGLSPEARQLALVKISEGKTAYVEAMLSPAGSKALASELKGMSQAEQVNLIEDIADGNVKLEIGQHTGRQNQRESQEQAQEAATTR